MKGYPFICLSILLSTCRATNSTFKWSNIRSSPTSSSSHGNLGDYVAAGIGINTQETSSLATTTIHEEYLATGSEQSADKESPTLASPTNDNQTQINDLSSQSPTQSHRTSTLTDAVLTTAPSTGGTSERLHITSNSTDATVSTKCWQSWLDYWSASSLNKVTYETSSYAPVTETKTELRIEQTLIPTSSWRSDIYTWTYSTLSTIFSDGYPVSVSVSYDYSTYSNVDWDAYTIYSSLSEFHTTFTETYNFYDRITTTQSTTALPTPACELPSVVPECSAQWSSYISASSWRYWNDFDDPSTGYFPGTPDCRQALVTGSSCASMASFYFARETMYGQADDVGWITEDSTSYFPASKSLAPGCSLGCQACSITGETVQLYYWPPSTASLVENGTETATLTPFARNDSSPRTVSIDGEQATIHCGKERPR